MKAPILIALALSLTACSDTPVDPDEAGYTALRDGNYARAVSYFDQAMAELDSGGSEHTDLSIARCGARAHQDVKAACTEFLSLAGSQDLGEKAYKGMVRNLFNAGDGGLLEAVTVVDAGIKKFPDSEGLKAYLEKLKAEAAKAEGGALSEALKGLGYA